jgi:hypothetical protein
MMPAMNRTGRGMNATPVVAEIGWDTKIESERDNDMISRKAKLRDGDHSIAMGLTDAFSLTIAIGFCEGEEETNHLGNY